jgi:hypothetical protein
MESKDIFSAVILCLVFVAGVAIVVSIVWLEHRKRTRALDVLRLYAERGEDPPASVIQALTNVSGRPPAAPPAPTTRGHHLAHAAGNAVFTVGLAALVWWRVSAFNDTSTGVAVAILAALFFAAGLAARLVGAYYAPDR